ncbi:MAG: SCP2 sterol-binding domain-containing protein [Candidatus Heimdallarchaeota archaeon]
MLLGSEEYVNEAERRINADVKYQELAKKVNDSYTLIFQPEPDKGVKEKLVLGFTIVNGKMVDKWIGDKPTSYILTAPYGVYVDILTGKLNVNRAFISRKLKVKGSIPRLLKTARATERLVNVLATIPTDFAGNYKERSTTA